MGGIKYMAKNRQGFTIVELLIVVVVIAILAAITIVSYNGIQTRAKVSVVQNDLRNIAKQMEIFRNEFGYYPASTQVSHADLTTVMKAANVYTSTRATSANWASGIYPPKRFVFCSPNNDPNRYAVVAEEPVLSITNQTQGAVTYYIDESGAMKSLSYNLVAGGEAVSLCVGATGVPVANWMGTWHVWSNAVPTNWAP